MTSIKEIHTASNNNNLDLPQEIAKTREAKTYVIGQAPALIWEEPKTPSQDSLKQDPQVESVPALGTTLEPETPAQANEEKDQRKLISLFQLSNILQEPYANIFQAVNDLNLSKIKVASQHTAVVLSFDQILQLRDRFLRKKIEETRFSGLYSRQVSLSEAARRLKVGVDHVVEAVDRFQIPIAVVGTHRLIAVGFLEQIASFSERQQALERLVRFSQFQRDEEFVKARRTPKTWLEKQSEMSEEPELQEGSVSTNELLKKLGISYVTFCNYRLTRVVKPIKIHNSRFYTPEQQEIIQEKLDGIRVARQKSKEPKPKPEPQRLVPPEGYITSGEACEILGSISREMLRIIKGRHSIKTIVVGPRKQFYFEEDVLAVKAKVGGDETFARPSTPEFLVRQIKQEIEELLPVSLSEFVDKHNLSFGEVLEAVRKLGWRFDGQESGIILNSWQQQMLVGFLQVDKPQRRRIEVFKEKPSLPEGAVSIREFLQKAGISYETLRKKMKLIGIGPIRIGKQKFLTQELQVALSNFIRRAPKRPKTVQAQVRQKPLAKGSSGKHALIKGEEPLFFEGKLLGEPLPAKEPDEAGRLYLEKFRRLERERKRLAAEQGIEQTPDDDTSVQLHLPQKAKENDRNGLGVGWQFTILHPKLGEKTFEIVFPDNVDAKAGKISLDSPLARALAANNHKKGDRIKVSAPAGNYEIELVSVVEGAVYIAPFD